MNKYRKSDDLPKERQPLSLLSSTPADACAYDQVDGGNLAQCRAFRGYIRFVELGIVKKDRHVCNGTFGADLRKELS